MSLRVASWNMHSAGRSRLGMRLALRRLARDTHKPEVICLQEAKRYPGRIKGYRRVAADSLKRREANNCVILVRVDVEIYRTEFLEVRGPEWRGVEHKDVMHPPHVYPWVVLATEGADRRVEVMCVHRTPGGPEAHEDTKRQSWAAEDRELKEWAYERHLRQPHRLRPLVGDQNDRESTTSQLSISDLAEHVGGDLIMRGIDGALVINGAGRIVRLDDKYGSDHHPVVLTMKEKNHE